MSALIGERGKGSLYAMPTPASTTPLANGFPFDSGTAMRLGSNLAHLAFESCRQIVTTPITNFSIETNPVDVFSNILPSEFSPPSAEPADTFALIPWGDRRWSRRFPYHGIADQNDGSGNATLRPVQVMVDLTETLTSIGGQVKLFAALTQSPDGWSLFGGTYLAFDSHTSATSSNQQVIMNLVPTAIFQDGTGRPCRSRPMSQGATLSISTNVIPVWLWVGCRALNQGFNGGALSVNSISAWEYR